MDTSGQDHSAQDTIAAIATAPGTGAIAVIRISGPQACSIIATCSSHTKPLTPRHATLLPIQDARGRILDEVIATYFQAPASFTGEDVVEISCHGGILVTRRLLERVLACGARPAEPGEFTRRAFEHGKLDLTQAEAIMDVISAGSDLALRAAQNQLQGAIHQRVQEALDTLIDITAHTTAYIDFPEEEITPDTVDQMLAKLDTTDQLLRRLLDTADEGRILREGVRTAIVGAPNVGKSSLLNSLLGFERAIVSSTAGTTRDTIEESITLADLRLRLIDTAGLHDSEDAIECAGMQRSLQAGATADLVIEVADATQPPVDLPPGIIGAKHLLLLNKCDLPLHPEQACRSAIHYSCRTGQGRQELEAAIRELFLHDTADADNFAAINTRHRFALLQAREALHRAREAFRAGESPEYTAVELYEAIDALGSISGKVDTEDILTRVFSTFCLGK